SAGAAALVKEALNSFLIAKVKIAVVFLLAANVLGLGLGSVVHQVLAQPHSAIPAGSSTKAEERKELVITGRVVHASDGQPVNGADVRLVRRGMYSGPVAPRQTTTNAQGEFRFDAVPVDQYRIFAFHGN